VVAHAEVDPPVRAAPIALVAAMLLLVTAAGVPLLTPGARAAVDPAASTRVTGNITGPTVLAVGANQRYLIHGWGGPAIAPNGTKVGNLTYYASVSAGNLTGVQITPSSAALLNDSPGQPLLETGSTAQVITISVEITSVFNRTNQSINFTYAVNVVTPYVVAATLVNDNAAEVQAVPVLVYLDGTQIGNVTIASIQPYADYNLSYDYATLGLSTGYHTFTLTLASGHGLVRFAGGTTSYSQTVYVPGPAANNTVWYVVGAVAFFGVLFIFGARLGARRRSPSKK
jgi:hypothetical protein